MKFPSRAAGPIAALILVATTAVILLARPRPGPTLAEVAAMAEAGRLDAAEASLALLLKHEPRDPGANLLAAQVAMGRSEPVTQSGMGSDPAPALAALDALGRVETRDPRLAALASLWRGKAARYLGRLEEAEAAWLEALRLDPTVPEAGWLLLQEYYLQGRSEEAQALALRLHQGEPDGRDRVLLLLEPLRQELMPPAPASLVLWFEPIAGRSPAGLRANIALGLALVRSSEAERGIALLRKVAEAHPGRREAWDALLTGLDEAEELEELAKGLDSLPAKDSQAPWTLKFRGRVAEDRGDLVAAAVAYRRAIEGSAANSRLEYRLARALRRMGERAEADRLDARHQAREAFRVEGRALYERAIAEASSGRFPDPELSEKLALLREKMGFPEQARAWRRLAGARPPA